MAGLDVKFVFGMLALFFQSICKTNQRICGPPRSDGSPDCCPYFYIDGDQCVECLAGYKPDKKNNCTEPCDFPDYGAYCQNTCNCSQEDCHHVNGCPVLECLAGYKTDKRYNCTEPCDFPDYGAYCESTCNCSQEDCHHVNGCHVLGTTASLVTTTETTLFSAIGTISGISTSTPVEKEECGNTLLKYLIPMVGAVLVVIMIVINIVNIYSYMKDRKEEPIDADV
ncbi:multiple epidermal growth factor-like domains protein 11 [Ostrea edulis]|uniref:multiple epidermal growth factor-like domains protein 11 n=1 Tax=Ostrea edulis TaxID=37623 RepID=UPI0024AF7B6E|nr:multiple epidermal growth factor-like domains protein 11 [Ostrea edulis]